MFSVIFLLQIRYSPSFKSQFYSLKKNRIIKESISQGTRYTPLVAFKIAGMVMDLFSNIIYFMYMRKIYN